jgi:photosystem II stability/assembly factor-like uncharacterized protein
MNTAVSGDDKLTYAARKPKRHAIVLIHGVGTRNKSDTLLDFGGPLISWVLRWHEQHLPRPTLTPRSAGGDPALARTPLAVFGIAAAPLRTLLAVAEGGAILRSVDGGQQWLNVPSPVSGLGSAESLLAVAFGSPTVAWATGTNGMILKSYDAGQSWLFQDSGTGATLRGVTATSNQDVWTVGDYGTILRSSDGGAQWTAQWSGANRPLEGIAALGNGNLIAVGDGIILRTADGGQSWVGDARVYPAPGDPSPIDLTTFDLRAVAAKDGTAWAVGQSRVDTSEVIIKTVTGGRTWTLQSSDYSQSVLLRGVTALSPAIAWAVGDGGVILATSDGETWQRQATASPDQIWFGVVALSERNVCVVGSAGVIATSRGETWVEGVDSDSGAAPALMASLSFEPTDTGDEGEKGARQPRAVLTLPNGDQWLFTEVWYASSYRVPPLGRALRMWPVILDAELTPKGLKAEASPPSPKSTASWEIVLLSLAGWLNSILMFVIEIVELFWPGAAFVLTLLGEIPLPAIGDTIFFRVSRQFWKQELGELETYIAEPIQGANLRQRVLDAQAQLRRRCGDYDDVTIIGHSLGAVVAHDYLASDVVLPAANGGEDGENVKAVVQASAVKKLITIGSVLSRLWSNRLPAAAERLLHRPIASSISWLDLYASHDTATGGRFLVPSTERGKWEQIYVPDATVQRVQRLEQRSGPNPYGDRRVPPGVPSFWPKSVEVTNEASVLTDHNRYFANDEQVLARLAAEIDETYYADSRYWRGNRLRRPDEDAGREMQLIWWRRYVRVMVLAFSRFLITVLALTPVYPILLAWIAIPAVWIASLAGALLERLFPDAVTAASLFLRGAFAAVLDVIPSWLVAILIHVLGFVLAYALFRIIWNYWDYRQREVSLRLIANAGRDEQVSESRASVGRIRLLFRRIRRGFRSNEPGAPTMA